MNLFDPIVGDRAPSELVTVTGAHLAAPSLEAIRRELGVLARSTSGSSVTLSCAARTMRIKYRHGRFDVLTYRTDYSVESMYTAPARVRFRAEESRPEVECGVLLECIASFFHQARGAA